MIFTIEVEQISYTVFRMKLLETFEILYVFCQMHLHSKFSPLLLKIEFRSV